MLGPKGNDFPGNTTEEDLRALTSLMHEYGAANFIVQLCNYNPDSRDGQRIFGAVPESITYDWLHALKQHGIAAKKFKSWGTDVRGGCGQLIGTCEEKTHKPHQ